MGVASGADQRRPTRLLLQATPSLILQAKRKERPQTGGRFASPGKSCHRI